MQCIKYFNVYIYLILIDLANVNKHLSYLKYKPRNFVYNRNKKCS